MGGGADPLLSDILQAVWDDVHRLREEDVQAALHGGEVDAVWAQKHALHEDGCVDAVRAAKFNNRGEAPAIAAVPSSAWVGDKGRGSAAPACPCGHELRGSGRLDGVVTERLVPWPMLALARWVNPF